MLQGTYSYPLVFASPFIASAASYTRHELAGTSYSSLGYLQEFCVQQMQVGRAFIKTLYEDPSHARLIVTDIIRPVHGLTTEAVAEGVETREQLVVLQELQYDQAKGLLLAKPVPVRACCRLPNATAVPPAAIDTNLPA